MPFKIWLENTRRTFRGARRNRSRSPVRTIRSARPSWEAFEDRIAPAGFTGFLDPDPAPGNHFGATVVALSTGNVVITSPDDNAGGTGAVAVYLFNGATGALISTLIGSQAGDHIGDGGVTALSNGNYVVSSPAWNNGAGAVTWGSGTAGVSGPVSATNSLVGSTANDSVGGGDDGGVTALSNGNYVVSSPNWANAVAANAGAVTWGSGTAGVSGIISTMNSAIGSVASSGLGAVVVDNVNGTSFGPFLTDGGGRVRVGSQATGFAATGFAAAQTITFGPLPDRTNGDAPFTLSASASSMLPVSYRIVDGAAYASITGNTVNILGAAPAGTVVTVEASQAGNGSYNAAPPVDQSFTIHKATSATALASTVSTSASGQVVTFTATVTSPAGTPTGTVDLLNGSTTIGMGTLGGNGQAIIMATLPQGSYSITAVYAGNSSFQGSSSHANEFTVNTPTPTPTLPQVLAIAGVSSKKGLTSFTVSYNEPLSSSSASSSGLYQVLAAVTKLVKKHKETLFTKALAIRSASPNSSRSTVTINLAKPFKRTVQVMVQGNITAANGASNSERFTQDLAWR